MSVPCQAETLLSKLLGGTDSGNAAKPAATTNSGRIIEEINVATTNTIGSYESAESSRSVQQKSIPTVDEGPSILEQMMTAHSLAKREKESTQKAEITGKSLGSGFKKGFFNKSADQSKKNEKKQQEQLTQSSNSFKPSPSKHKADVIDVKAKSVDRLGGLVVDEVQQALKADEHPIIAQLNQKGNKNLRYPSNGH